MKNNRVVYITDTRLPSRAANSVHVMEMCHAFIQSGNVVHLIAPFSKDYFKLKVRISKYYGVTDDIKVHLLIRLPKFLGLKLYCIVAALLAWALRPDYVITRSLYAALNTTNLGLKTVFETHDPYLYSSFPNIINSILSSPFFIKIIVISQAQKSIMVKDIDESHMVVLHDGARKRLGSTLNTATYPTGLKIVYTGHLYEGRGIDLIIQCARALKEIQFVIVGGKEKDIKFWREYEGVSSMKNIYFTGYVPSSEIPNYQALADILIAPYMRKVSIDGGGNTVDWMSPLKIFEYMSSGKAIISSKLPALMEILTDGENALLCDPDRPNEWIKAIKKLSSDPKARELIADNAFRDFENKHTWLSRVEQIESFV